jgi:lysophospholipase L1-like esterase
MAGQTKVSRIIAIGGSTTLSEFLDDSETWPHLLMQELNQRQNRTFVYAANAGMNGHNTADHLQLLNRFPLTQNADILLFLIGINDFTPTLAFEGRSTQKELEERATSESFTQPLRYPFYTRSRIYALAQAIRPLVGLNRKQSAAEWLAARRQIRAQAPVVPMPDLKLALQEYESRVRYLAQVCQSVRRRCVFLTQPTMWRNDLTAAEEGLLFYGWAGTMEAPKGFVSAADLAHGMNQYNESLLKVCQTDFLECYDLASAIPKDTTAFYDDCHFNEHGAKLVARFLADRLVKDADF